MREKEKEEIKHIEKEEIAGIPSKRIARKIKKNKAIYIIIGVIVVLTALIILL